MNDDTRRVAWTGAILLALIFGITVGALAIARHTAVSPQGAQLERATPC